MRLAFERWHRAPQTSRDLVMPRPLVRKVRTDKVCPIVPGFTFARPGARQLDRTISTNFPRAIAGVIAAAEADLSPAQPGLRLEVFASNRETTWCLTSIIATGLMLSFAPTGL